LIGTGTSHNWRGLSTSGDPAPSRSARGRTGPLPRLSRDGFFFPLLRNPPAAGARLSRWQQGPRC
jgi:hypothetical protein